MSRSLDGGKLLARLHGDVLGRRPICSTPGYRGYPPAEASVMVVFLLEQRSRADLPGEVDDRVPALVFEETLERWHVILHLLFEAVFGFFG